MSNDKRIIEIEFPVDEVRGSGAREIAELHQWFARRPLGPSRGTAYAALSNPLQNDRGGSRDSYRQAFIAELCKWENAKKPLWIDEARRDILDAHDGQPPKVLDPFGGGGSIPLEAQRLGCETHSCDLNPVAVLIQKCTLEYPQKYRKRLYDDVKKWGEQIIAQVTEELEQFYPKEPDGSHRYATIWARTLPCQNLSCNTVIPLVRKYWLAKGRIALFPYEDDGQISFRIVGDGYEPIPEGFDPAKGTVVRANVTCPVCKNTIPARDTHRLFHEEVVKERILAVVTQHPNVAGKRYRLSTDADMEVLASAQILLAEKRQSLHEQWGMDPVPDEETPVGTGGAPVMVRLYNLNTYGALFNPQQQLSLITFTEKIREAHTEMLAQGYDVDYACAVTTYLGMWLNRIAQDLSNLCRWRDDTQGVVGLFGMQALSIAWDYGDANPLLIATNKLQTILRPLKHLSEMRANPVVVKQASATSLRIHYPANHFDAVLTDPPYYNNIGYSYLSDFFYVWLKRSVKELHPELFQTDMTPKKDEIVAYPHLDGQVKATERFEKGLSRAFAEVRRVLKPNGITVIVYAHKSKEGWETLINALLDSGLVITGAWPIETEQKNKFGGTRKALLATSIYMVARKTEREAFGLYQEVRANVEEHLKKRYAELWESGLSGANLFIATIGSALQIFGKYEEVIDDNDKTIRADKMLQDIREIVATCAMEQVIPNATALTRFYLYWREAHGEKRATFDAANNLASISAGLNLTEELGRGGAVLKEGTFVRVLGPHEREFTDIPTSDELVDILHHALWFWRKSKHEAMIQHLARGQVGLNEPIYTLAQAVSLTLPLESQERRWLDGWLAVKEVIKEEIKSTLEEAKQTRIA